MQIKTPVLFIEINKLNFTFVVGDENQDKNFHIIYKDNIPLKGIEDNKFTDLDLVMQTIKKNIYSIEQKINFVFKEVILIIDNFDFSFTNLSGFKNLNGSQLSKENITYILNSLKSKVDEFEESKIIIHIFNTKYSLDKKKMENLPIGLFGSFYTQELSFILMNKNDYKNWEYIFKKSNLKIKKIIYKSFIEGVNLINQNSNIETFFILQINEKYSKLIFFENSALKFVQNFEFGTDFILSDISKIISLNLEKVKKILLKSDFSKDALEHYIEKEFFEGQNFRKIKKKLILEISEARINEIVDLIFLKNINLRNFSLSNQSVFLIIKDKLIFNCFKNLFQNSFRKNSKLSINQLDYLNLENIYSEANKLVQFGWKKEAIPVVLEKRSIIARVFHLIFGK